MRLLLLSSTQQAHVQAEMQAPLSSLAAFVHGNGIKLQPKAPLKATHGP